MARFFVGQRVKVVKPRYGHPQREGWIRGASDIGEDYLIETPEYPSTAQDRLWSCYGWQLEPITDSYDVTSWDTCVWKPEHLRSTA